MRERREIPGGRLLLLADDLFFVAHDSLSMKRRLAGQVMSLGLGAALLGEQALSQTITIKNGQVWFHQLRPFQDRVRQRVLDRLASEQQGGRVRDWLNLLGQTAHGLVRERMVDEGYLRGVHVRRIRATVRYAPANPTIAGGPEGRLAMRLTRCLNLELQDIVLAGLVRATGLDRYVLGDSPPHADLFLTHMLDDDCPGSLRELVAETQAAVGDATLTPQI
jgi:hypothetical protein